MAAILTMGVDVNQRDAVYDSTALHWAGQNGHVECVKARPAPRLRWAAAARAAAHGASRSRVARAHAPAAAALAH